MTYRVQFTPAAALYFHHMPREGQDAFFARAAELAEAPWDGVGLALPGTDPGFRNAVFGGLGVVYFALDEATETITFLELVWAG